MITNIVSMQHQRDRVRRGIGSHGQKDEYHLDNRDLEEEMDLNPAQSPSRIELPPPLILWTIDFNTSLYSLTSLDVIDMTIRMQSLVS